MKRAVLEQSDQASNLQHLLDPAKVFQSLKDADIDTCRALFAESRDVGERAWMAMALCANRAMEVSSYGDKALESLAQHFEYHRSWIARAAKIAKEIIVPRLEAGATAEQFPIGEITFYAICVNAAPVVGKPAIDLIEIAENKRAEAGGHAYSTTQFKKDIEYSDDEGETCSDAPAIKRLIRKAAKVEIDSVKSFCEHTDARQLLGEARDALRVFQEIESGLAARAGVDQ